MIDDFKNIFFNEISSKDTFFNDTFIKNKIKEFGACIFIDTNALLENYKIITQQTSSTVAPVVKNDAYGLGIKAIFPLLKPYSSEYFVANLHEAIILRNLDKEITIYVLMGVLGGQEETLRRNNLIPVLSTLKQIKVWNDYAQNIESSLKCILQTETGMNRFGLSLKDAQHIGKNLDLLSHLEITCILSHFACSDEENHQSVEIQYKRFKEINAILPQAPKYSLAASYGIFLDKKYHFDIVRPGIALYGGNPTPYKENPMKSVIHFFARILQIRTLEVGESVGYGHLWQAQKETTLATIPVGYADGIIRSCSNSAYLFIENHKVPIVGRISMDSLTLDITDLPDDLKQEGQVVEILGENISLDELATTGETNHCEIINILSRRYPRFYIGK